MRVFNSLSFCLLVIIVVSCVNESHENIIRLKNGYMVTLPSSIHIDTNEKKGIDSYLFDLKGAGDFHLSGEVGIYLNHVFNEEKVVFDSRLRDSIQTRMGVYFDSTIIYFSDFPEVDSKQNIFSKNFFKYDTVNNIRMKVVQPKVIGDGITGMIVWDKEKGLYLSLYGENLSERNHTLALNIFASLKKDIK